MTDYHALPIFSMSNNDEAKLGLKAKPISAFSVGECSTQDELSKMCFPSSPVMSFPVTSLPSSSNVVKGSDSKSTSDSSFNPTRHLLAPLISKGIELEKSELKVCQESRVESKEELDPLLSFFPDGTAIPISCTASSRQGRANQRWDKCAVTNNIIRLATGCVPITNDGRILFCSSAKKKEWILPKGGWETDEIIEESAARETYEEAGVLGTLGPKIIDVTFETRKEKKKRMDNQKLEAELKHQKLVSEMPPKPDIRTGGKITIPALNPQPDTMNTNGVNSRKSPLAPVDAANTNESVYPSSPAMHCTMVKVTFFALYVSQVLSDWPESGRSRKAFSIDEAIRTVKRQELRDVLLEVKRRGLHNVAIQEDDPIMVSESEN